MNVDLINKITDYVLLNAYSLNSSGFYNRKAGVALTLFEVARLMEEDYLEEHAFNLMDMSEDGTVSGVARYLETLLRGLASYADIEVCWTRFDCKIITHLHCIRWKVYKIATSMNTIII